MTICVLAVLIVACSDVRTRQTFTTAPIVAAPSGTSSFFDRDVQDVFDRSCTGGCHEPGGVGERDAGLDLTSPVSYDELFDPTLSRNGPQVIAGDPDNSLLIWKLEGVDSAGRVAFGDRMPLERPPLDIAEIAAIRDWIGAGALRTKAPPTPPDIRAVVASAADRVQITFTKAVDSALIPTVRVTTDAGEVSVLSTMFDGADLLTATTSPLAAGVSLTIEIDGVMGADGLRAATLSESFSYRPETGFSRDIQPLFDQNCAFVGCHAASDRFPPGEGLVMAADTAWRALVGVASSQVPTTPRVTPGSPDSSYLMQKISGSAGILGDRMPQGGPFLNGGDLALVRLWIDQGAMDN